MKIDNIRIGTYMPIVGNIHWSFEENGFVNMWKHMEEDLRCKQSAYLHISMTIEGERFDRFDSIIDILPNLTLGHWEDPITKFPDEIQEMFWAIAEGILNRLQKKLGG